MGLLKKKFKGNFTQVPNVIIEDNRISYRAKGIYLYLVSKPDNWNYYVMVIIRSSTEGRDAVRAAIKELEKYGYLARVRSKNNYGRFSGWDYYIYDEPTDGNPVRRENRSSEKPSVGKTSPNNTKPTNTDFNNTDCICETREEFRKYIRENFINQDLLEAKDKDTKQQYIISIDPRGHLYDKRGTNFTAQRALGIWDTLFDYYKRHQLEFQKFAYKPHAELKKF